MSSEDLAESTPASFDDSELQSLKKERELELAQQHWLKKYGPVLNAGV